MKKPTKPTRTVRTLIARELAAAGGGYEQGGISAPDDWDPKAIIKQIGGSGLVIPGLT